jgi:N-acetylneuraminic acid mutarotase
VYVAGGRRSGGHFNTFESYDVSSDRWQRLPSMPTARSGLGAAIAGGMFVTVGGEGPRIFPEVEGYELDAKTWRRLPDLAVPVHGVGVAAIDSNLYAFVGGTRVGGAPSRVVQVLAID